MSRYVYNLTYVNFDGEAIKHSSFTKLFTPTPHTRCGLVRGFRPPDLPFPYCGVKEFSARIAPKIRGDPPQVSTGNPVGPVDYPFVVGSRIALNPCTPTFLRWVSDRGRDRASERHRQKQRKREWGGLVQNLLLTPTPLPCQPPRVAN